MTRDATEEGIVLGSLSRILQPHLAAERTTMSVGSETTEGEQDRALVIAEKATMAVDSETKEGEQDRALVIAESVASDTSAVTSEPLPVSTQLPSPILNIATDDVTVPIMESDVQRQATLQTTVTGDVVSGMSSQRAALNITTDRVETLNITANQTEEVLPSAPAQLDLTETVQLVGRDREIAMATTTAVPLYPRLDSITRELHVGECAWVVITIQCCWGEVLGR